MISRVLPVLAFVSALGSGLAAGLLFVFSVCVMTALSRLPSAQGIAAMQSINVTILDPWFFIAYTLLTLGAENPWVKLYENCL